MCLPDVLSQSHNVMLKTMGDGTRVIGKVGDFGLSVKMDSAETHMSNMFQVWGVWIGAVHQEGCGECGAEIDAGLVKLVKRVPRAWLLHHQSAFTSRADATPVSSLMSCVPHQPLSCALQGTLTHMAPEVMLSGHISKSADVYAFGILLWELYTGGHPFRGLPRALLGHQVTMEDRRPMFPPDTPGHFKALAEWCWSKDPESRCGQLPGAGGCDSKAAPWAAGWYQAAACTCQHSETYEQ